MNLQNEKYKKFALVREMLETAEVVKKMPVEKILAHQVGKNNLFLTGEGSSRIFPAKNALYNSLKGASRLHMSTDGGNQAMEYDLTKHSVFVMSNSGKTAECVRLIRRLKAQGHSNITGVAAHSGTPVIDEANQAYVLSCGSEDAVAATKSVVEQALYYDLLFRKTEEQELPDLKILGDAIEEVLTMEIPGDIVQRLVTSPVIYFAGRNNGVAEELTLKTNEITRKKSDFLEGTYAVHGIEEVMGAGETVIVIDPFEEEEEKFSSVLKEGVGLEVIAISSRETSFPTIKIPSLSQSSAGNSAVAYLQLAAGWNILVETGIAAGINLDKPERARKVGNEFQG